MLAGEPAAPEEKSEHSAIPPAEDRAEPTPTAPAEESKQRERPGPSAEEKHTASTSPRDTGPYGQREVASPAIKAPAPQAKAKGHAETIGAWCATHGGKTIMDLSKKELGQLLEFLTTNYPQLATLYNKGVEKAYEEVGTADYIMAEAASRMVNGYEMIGWQWLSDLMITKSGRHLYSTIEKPEHRPANGPMSPFAPEEANLTETRAEQLCSLKILKCQLDGAITIYFNTLVQACRPESPWVPQHRVLGLLRHSPVSLSVEGMLDTIGTGRPEAELRFENRDDYEVVYAPQSTSDYQLVRDQKPEELVQWWKSRDRANWRASRAPPQAPPQGQRQAPPAGPPPQHPNYPPPFPPGSGQMVPMGHGGGQMVPHRGGQQGAGRRGGQARPLGEDEFTWNTHKSGYRYQTPMVTKTIRRLEYDIAARVFYRKNNSTMRNTKLVPVIVAKSYQAKIGFVVTKYNICMEGMVRADLCPRGDSCTKYHCATIGTVVTEAPGSGRPALSLGSLAQGSAQGIGNLLDDKDIVDKGQKYYRARRDEETKGDPMEALRARFDADINPPESKVLALPAPPAQLALPAPSSKVKYTGVASKASRKSARTSKKQRRESSDSENSSSSLASSDSSTSSESQDRKRRKKRRRKHKKKSKKSSKSKSRTASSSSGKGRASNSAYEEKAKPTETEKKAELTNAELMATIATLQQQLGEKSALAEARKSVSRERSQQ